MGRRGERGLETNEQGQELGLGSRFGEMGAMYDYLELVSGGIS